MVILLKSLKCQHKRQAGGVKWMLTKYMIYRYNSPRFYVPSSVPNPSSICVFYSERVKYATFQARGGAAGSSSGS